MNSLKISFLLVFALAVAGCASSQTTKPDKPPEPQHRPGIADIPDMDDASVLQTLGLDGATLAYLVIDGETGKVLEARAPDVALPPASTAKIPTMFAGLSILGPTYRFTTQIMARGTLKAGVLTGDIVLSGDGDPLLTAGDLRALVVRLKDIGVTRVDGHFFYDSTLSEFPEVETTQPEDAPYNQGVSGLNHEFNRAILTRPGPNTDNGVYTTPPEALNTVPKDANPLAGRFSLPVQKPGLLTAQVFRKFAALEGIALPEPLSGEPQKGSVILAQIRSQPLIEIARAGLEYSNNMVAEVVGLAASRRLGSPIRSLSESADTLGIWLSRDMPELKGFETALTNHSGLSTVSRMTPNQMTTILHHALNKTFDGWRFDTLLAPGGARDNFRGRFRSPPLAYKVWAKSGTMRYIKGLAGYLDSTSGKRLVFAIFTHDADKRAALEKDPARFSHKSKRASSRWRNSVEHMEEGLILRWITSH